MGSCPHLSWRNLIEKIIGSVRDILEDILIYLTTTISWTKEYAYFVEKYLNFQFQKCFCSWHATHQTANLIQENIKEMRWTTLEHPPYNPSEWKVRWLEGKWFGDDIAVEAFVSIDWRYAYLLSTMTESQNFQCVEGK